MLINDVLGIDGFAHPELFIPEIYQCGKHLQTVRRGRTHELLSIGRKDTALQG